MFGAAAGLAAKVANPGEKEVFHYTTAEFVGHGVVRATGTLTDTRDELNAVRDLVESDDFKHFSLRSLSLSRTRIR